MTDKTLLILPGGQLFLAGKKTGARSRCLSCQMVDLGDFSAASSCSPSRPADSSSPPMRPSPSRSSSLRGSRTWSAPTRMPSALTNFPCSRVPPRRRRTSASPRCPARTQTRRPHGDRWCLAIRSARTGFPKAHPKPADLYPKFIAFIRDAMEDLTRQGYNCTRKGVFRHTGENDTYFGPYFRNYAA